MKKILLPLMVLIMVLGLALVPATPAALADDDPNVCLCELGPGLNLDLSGHGNSYVGRFHLYFDSVNCVGGELHYGWCVDLANPMGYWCFDANLVNASRLTPWCEIAYIMTHFSPTSNEEAAAIQLAIWKYIEGGKNNVHVTSEAVENRANDIYDLAEARSVNLFGPPLELVLTAKGAPVDLGGGKFSQDWTTTIIGGGCLEGIAVDFSTSNSFSDTTTVTETTVPTNAGGEASVTLYYDTAWDITASAEGEWPVIIEPLDTLIQRTVILEPYTRSVTKSGQPGMGTITAHKFNDLDGDGEQVAGEGDLADWTMNLYSGFGCSGTPLQSLVTDSNGNAVFSGLAAGDYSVGEELKAGWTNTTSLCVDVTLPEGGSETAEFGNRQPGTITAHKFNDLDGDGEQVAGEGDLADWTMNLYSGFGCSGTPLQSLVTDSNGNAVFSGLAAGDYSVGEELKAGWTNTTSLCVDVTLPEGGSETAEFGNRQPGTITAHKFNDLDGDGEQVAGEGDLADWTMNLYSGFGCSGTPLQSLVTDSNGNAVFSGLAAGDYSVGEELKAGWTNTTSLCVDVTLPEGGSETAEFGNRQPGTITAHKFNDLDGDGEQVAGEGDLADWTMNLYSGFGCSGTPLQSLVTDSNGNAVFSGLAAGDYSVGEELKAGWTNTTSLCVDVTLPEGGSETAEFGNRQPGTITAHKFNDLDGDGEQVAGEGDLADWTMNLYSGFGCSGTPLQSLVTDSNGNAVFSGLAAGDYSVGEELKAGWTNTTSLCVDVTLPADGSETAEFGNRQKGTITAHKFNDIDGNTIQATTGEDDLAGWEMTLYDGPGCTNELATGITDSNGNVVFSGLDAGVYWVGETLQAGWTNTTPLCVEVTLPAGGSETAEFGNQHCSIEVVKTALLCGEGQGCTPGYWKVPQHHDDWLPTGYATDNTVGSVFDVPLCVTVLADDTLLEALNYGGGDDVLGMAQNLLRIGVAALLNAAHPSVNYPRAEGAVITAINDALLSCDRDTMETLKDELDADNNLGCPFGQDPANRGDGCCPGCCPGVCPLDVSVGDTVMYCYVVTNTSSDVTLTNVTVTDDIYGEVFLDPTTLGPGESVTGTLTHVVVENDIPLVTNIATATGTLPGGTPVTDTDPCTINVGTVQIGATITGQKFQWVNCTGDRVPLGGWEIELWKLNLLDGSESKVATTLTDVNGQFTFEDVAAGVYKVREVLQPDWEQCTDLPLREYYWVIVYGVDAATEATIAVDVYGYALLFGNSPLV